MVKKIKINYKIKDSPYDICLSEQDLKNLPPQINIKVFKQETKKYLSQIDNQFNLNGKIVKGGKLEFVIENEKN